MSREFIHIGMHKTGTTWLQAEVFEKLSGFYFVRPPATLKAVTQRPEDLDLLISDESLCGRAWGATEVTGGRTVSRRQVLSRLVGLFPDGRLIVGFRRHADLIDSLYRQYLHVGGTSSIEQFFGDDGLIREPDLLFGPIISLIQDLFALPPFFFTFDDFISNRARFLEELLTYLGVGEVPKISVGKNYNRGVRGYRARLLRTINRLSRSPFNPRGLLPLRSAALGRLGLDPRNICQRLLPGDWGVDVGLSSEQRERIEEAFSGDWHAVLKAVESSREGLISPGSRLAQNV